MKNRPRGKGPHTAIMVILSMGSLLTVLMILRYALPSLHAFWDR